MKEMLSFMKYVLLIFLVVFASHQCHQSEKKTVSNLENTIDACKNENRKLAVELFTCRDYLAE